MNKNSPVKITELILGLYEKFGNEDYIGEPVSQLEHMAQAASLARNAGYDDEVILGAFLHDIGHLCAHGEMVESMNGYGNVDHEKLGADFLEECGFSDRVLMLVQGHVQAKRYLTFKTPDYFDQLSEASKQTLLHQGGVMSKEEAATFEQSNDSQLLVMLRYWDDEAKEINVPVEIIPVIREIMIRHLSRHHI